MARNYGNVLTAIWRLDGDFVKRSASAQRLYLLLATQPEISACGVLPLRVRRWSALSPDGTESDVIQALKELEEHRYIVVDGDTEELLVRSFTRHDGGYANPRRLPSIRDAADAIESSKLLVVLAGEFDRLELAEQWRGKAKTQVNSHSDSQTDSQSIGEPHIDGMAIPSATARTATHNPQPTTRSLREPDAAAPAKKRGTRIPDDFTVSAEMVAWARGRVPHVDGPHETEKFINYWQSKSRDAARLDWDKTWRNWMLTAAERTPTGQRASPAGSTAPERIPAAERCPEHPSYRATSCGPCRARRIGRNPQENP